MYTNVDFEHACQAHFPNWHHQHISAGHGFLPPPSLPTVTPHQGAVTSRPGPYDPGLTPGSGIGSAQPTCCQQLLLRNSHPSSPPDKGSAGQDNKSLARAVRLAAGANPTARPGQSSTVLRLEHKQGTVCLCLPGLVSTVWRGTWCDASYHVSPSASGLEPTGGIL